MAAGICIPTALENCNVLDLGSGAGRDVYILSQLVGEKGFVTGVDMTAEQLATAEVHKDWHTKKFGYAQSNVRFLEGYLEKLDALDLDRARSTSSCRTASSIYASTSWRFCVALTIS